MSAGFSKAPSPFFCTIYAGPMRQIILSAVLLLAPFRGLGAENWTLERYVGEARASSSDLKKAAESVELSSAEYVSALASFYLPTVYLNASNSPYSVYNSPRLELEKADTSAGVTASLNLFNNFKDRAALDSARLSRVSAENALWKERQGVTVNALVTYYDVLRKKRLLEVVRTSLKSYEEQYQKTQQYYKDGMKSYSDVLKSEITLRSSQLQEVTSSESYRNALMDFHLFIARSPRGEAELEDASYSASVAPPEPDKDLEWALRNRVEIKLARLELDLAELRLKKDRLENLPNLSADAYYSRDGIGSWGKPAAGTVNPVYYLKLSLTVPLGPETFSDRKNLVAGWIGLARQVRALNDLKLRVEREVFSKALALETALKTYEVSKMKADISRQNLEIIKEKYGTGQAGIIELGEAQNDNLSSQSELANALYDLLLSRAYYDSAVGKQLW